MTSSIQDTIVRLCSDTHVPRVQAVFGAAGVDAIFRVMNVVRNVYAHIEPERFAGTLVVYHPVLPSHSLRGTGGQVVVLSNLANATMTDLVLQTDGTGAVYRRSEFGREDVEKLAESAVVYRYSNGKEEFLAGREQMDVFRLDPVALSQFSVPTFATMREALEHYANDSVLESTCLIFRTVWRDADRLFLKVTPESAMRDSLTQYLRNRLGADYDVMPEQNVDESHPVDIRVSTRLANTRLMLIEIKWLGDSLREDGEISMRYRDARAREGAEQLVGYVDKQVQSTPNRVCHAYYVVIDARRKGLTKGTRKISKADALHYEDREVRFDPAYHKNRDDFEEPFRMFARPVFGA